MITIPVWQKIVSLDSPGERQFYAAAFDHTNNLMLLFGGTNEGGGTPFNDTWTFDGTTWTLQTPATSPPAYDTDEIVGYPQAAWHNATGKIVMLQGNSDGDSCQTWTWDPGSLDWTLEAPANQPGQGHAGGFTPGPMAWDGVNDTVLMFGGNFPGDATSNETWSWDGTDWTQLAPGSSPPVATTQLFDIGGMAWDAANNNIVLFVSGQTWTWDGTDWTHHFPDPFPPPRGTAGIDYHTGFAAIVMFGGIMPLGGSTLNDTWKWSGSAWTDLEPALSPSNRAAPLVGDPSRDIATVHGGYSAVGAHPHARDDTWELTAQEIPTSYPVFNNHMRVENQ